VTLYHQLYRYFSNTWMCDPRFLSVSAHTWFGCSLVFIVAARIGPGAAWLTLPILACCAAVKEFIYDAHFEIPQQTTRDGWEGFLSYIGGAVLGILLTTQA